MSPVHSSLVFSPIWILRWQGILGNHVTQSLPVPVIVMFFVLLKIANHGLGI